MDAVDRIFLLIKQKGLSQKEFADGIGTRSATVSDWKRKLYTPTTAKYVGIAEFFGVSLDYLLTGKEDAVGEKNFNLNGNQVVGDARIENSFNSDKSIDHDKEMLLSYFDQLPDEAKRSVRQYCSSLVDYGADVLGLKRCLQYIGFFNHLIFYNQSFWELSLLLDIATENETKFLSNILKTELEKRGVDCDYYLSKERLDMIQPK